MSYSIGITTYSYRYTKFLKKLLNDIRQFNDNEIILGINGDYKQDFNECYRKEILCFMSTYSKVFPFVFPVFRSLSKIWNNIVINSSNEYVLILNDDTSILNKTFFDLIQENIDLHKTSFMVDGKFCCFVIKKSELNDVGWFDERFLGIGWEDTEFKERYRKKTGRDFLNVNNVLHIKMHIDWENVVINQRVGGGKYSAFNKEFYEKKELFVEQYPHEKFYWENKEKL